MAISLLLSMVPPIPQAAWAAPSSTNSAPALNLALASNVKYQLENGKTYTLSAASVSNTVIEVASGRTATVVVPKNVAVTINDYTNGCSPISLLGSGKLTLVVDGTLTVTGGAGEAGSSSSGSVDNASIARVPGNGGAGGFAGISVPTGSTLTVTGAGTLLARGGDAGNGGMDTAGDIQQGAGGGGGAGAGIGGNGGNGGKGAGSATEADKDGKAGIKAGNIYLYGSVAVTAYGGAGGAGGSNRGDTGGGGGYPAAGVGGGGAGGGGGTYCPGGSGFTGATQEKGPDDTPAHDGVAGIAGNATSNWSAGAGYFSVDTRSVIGSAYWGSIGGGGAGYAGNAAIRSGSGGQGGAGGSVYKSNIATLVVANGNYKTAVKQKWGNTPTPIYAQSGYDLALVRTAGVTNVNARTKSALESELGTKGKSSTIQATALAGVGSGAGYLESSNGSFSIQKVPERVDGATLYMGTTEYF